MLNTRKYGPEVGTWLVCFFLLGGQAAWSTGTRKRKKKKRKKKTTETIASIILLLLLSHDLALLVDHIHGCLVALLLVAPDLAQHYVFDRMIKRIKKPLEMGINEKVLIDNTHVEREKQRLDTYSHPWWQGG